MDNKLFLEEIKRILNDAELGDSDKVQHIIDAGRRYLIGALIVGAAFMRGCDEERKEDDTISFGE